MKVGIESQLPHGNISVACNMESAYRHLKQQPKNVGAQRRADSFGSDLARSAVLSPTPHA